MTVLFEIVVFKIKFLLYLNSVNIFNGRNSPLIIDICGKFSSLGCIGKKGEQCPPVT